MARTEIMLTGVRLASVTLFEANAYKKDNPPTYFIRGLIDKDSETAAKFDKAIKDLMKEEWKDQAAVIYKKAKAGGKYLLHDGDAQADKEGFDETVYYFNASRKEEDGPPSLFHRKASRQPYPEKEDGLFYPGAYVNVKVELYTWSNEHGKSVGCGLLGVQFVEHGETLSTSGGTSKATAEDFPDLDEEEAPGDDWAE